MSKGLSLKSGIVLLGALAILTAGIVYAATQFFDRAVGATFLVSHVQTTDEFILLYSQIVPTTADLAAVEFGASDVDIFGELATPSTADFFADNGGSKAFKLTVEPADVTINGVPESGDVVAVSMGPAGGALLPAPDHAVLLGTNSDDPVPLELGFKLLKGPIELGLVDGDLIGFNVLFRAEVIDTADVVQVSAGSSHTCALLNTGKVRCWGSGSNGRLGYGNPSDIGDDETPASAGDVDVGRKVSQISTGVYHTCALLDTGSVRCWGTGDNGRLGFGNTNAICDNETPASAGDVDVGGIVTQISAGREHTCALLDTGRVRCWGSGSDGRLGYGNTDDIGDNETPASVGDVDVKFGVRQIQISAGDHTCVLLITAKVRCWGDNFRGKLGYGNTDTIGDDETPASIGPDVSVTFFGELVTRVVAGRVHTCALLNAGNIRCWGDGFFLGYAGSSPIGDNELPKSAGDVDVGGTVTQVTLGFSHTCALLDTGKVRCWGRGSNGKLGYGNVDDVQVPSSAGDVTVLGPGE